MAQGIQIWNSAGNLILDTPDLITRVVLTMTVTQDGSYMLPYPAGTRFAAYIVAGGDTNMASVIPFVSVNGLVVSWTLWGYIGTNNTLVILRY